MSDDLSWLDGERTPEQEEQLRKGIEFAQLYLVFVDTDRGRELLKHLDRVHLYKRTPVDSSIQQYAADEAIRAFVAGIHTQIELAKSRD